MMLGDVGRAAAGYGLALVFGVLSSSCSSPPKPLPGGPPPEYETPRTYNGLGGPAEAAPPSSGPGAPRPEPDPAKPGDPEAAPPN